MAGGGASTIPRWLDRFSGWLDRTFSGGDEPTEVPVVTPEPVAPDYPPESVYAPPDLEYTEPVYDTPVYPQFDPSGYGEDVAVWGQLAASLDIGDDTHAQALLWSGWFDQTLSADERYAYREEFTDYVGYSLWKDYFDDYLTDEDWDAWRDYYSETAG